ncbi:MAG: DUF2220 family protein [Deltaproteobacteria bacterium]|jgi:hypothetical protein|nr:DUF2220 family protein [Deltaproteobacteria bacterium]
MRSMGDVKRVLESLFERKHPEWLETAESPDPGKWPVSVSLKPPSEKEAAANFPKVKEWISHWNSLKPEFGALKSAEVRWRHMGTQIIPGAVEIPNPETVALWTSKSEAWSEARKRHAKAVSVFPELKGIFSRFKFELFELDSADFSRLMGVVSWLKANPNPNLYPRELPIEGVDGKWMDSRKKSVAALASEVLKVDAGGKNFRESLGIKTPPFLARLRPLDPKLRAAFGGWGDLTVPLDDLKNFEPLPRPRAVVIVENLQTGLSMKDLPETVLFTGLGNGAVSLGAVPWVKDLKCLYWGDLDTHGFAILSRVRERIPGLKSILMDFETLMSHKSLWGTENSPHKGAEPTNLTPGELKLYSELKNGRWGKNIRLEQERIAWDAAWPIIEKEFENPV